jgi:Ca-activated chloride channel homolog
VVLTDGANTQGVDPQTAAKQAADRRVRVFTIGFGTTTPAPMVCSSNQINSGFGGAGGLRRFDRGGRNPLTLDEAALRQIASTTGGTYYRAQNAGQLTDVLDKLPASFSLVTKHEDIAAWFAGAGGLIIAVAVGLSMWWSRTRHGPARPDNARSALRR